MHALSRLIGAEMKKTDMIKAEKWGDFQLRLTFKTSSCFEELKVSEKMKWTDEQEVELRTTIASLYYLAKDAENVGLDQVSKIIMLTINELDKSLKEGGLDLSDLIIKNDLFPLLEFMYKYSNEEKFEMIAQMVQEKENSESHDLHRANLIN